MRMKRRSRELTFWESLGQPAAIQLVPALCKRKRMLVGHVVSQRYSINDTHHAARIAQGKCHAGEPRLQLTQQ